ncbi:MAG: thioredoxin fold domain-containing protein [Balneolales bacterium]|nr:thioredoxin fold domain-containing protein [Balneolales bacterium]
MKSILVLLAFMVVACGSDTADNGDSQNIQSRSIEQMSSREAQLLGLDKIAQGDEDAWTGPKLYSLDEAQALAVRNDKKILLDVYTVWCGYCRKMAAETYPNAKVKQNVEEYFYIVRLNAESDKTVIFNGESITERELAQALGVTSFPTTIFIGNDGEPIGIQPGFMEAGMFANLVGFVGSEAYRTESFDDYSSRN